MQTPRLTLGKVAIGWILFLWGAAVLIPSHPAAPSSLAGLVLGVFGILLLATAVAAFRYFKKAWEKSRSVSDRTAYVLWVGLETIVAVGLIVLLVAFGFIGLRTLLHKPSMVGGYVLPSGCNGGEIRLSQVYLYPDGTYKQHHELKGDRVIEAFGKHWKFYEGKLFLEGFRVSGHGELPDGGNVVVRASPARPRFFSLPDSTCVYMGPK